MHGHIFCQTPIAIPPCLIDSTSARARVIYVLDHRSLRVKLPEPGHGNSTDIYKHFLHNIRALRCKKNQPQKSNVAEIRTVIRRDDLLVRLGV